MHHAALDRPGADDRNFDDNIVKALWLEAGEGGHLGTTFDLESADGVRAGHEIVNRGVILRNSSDIDRMFALRAQSYGVLHRCHHAETKKVHLNDAEVLAIVFIPLRDNPARHGGVLERNYRAERVLRDDHATGVLAQMSRQAVNLSVELERSCRARMVSRNPRLLQLIAQAERVREITVAV